MLRHLLLTTALSAFALSPALAQETGTGTAPQSPTEEVPLPPAAQDEPMTQDQPTAEDQTAPLAPTDEAAEPLAETAAEQPVTPPPAEAIITAESATDMRADKLIGTSVYNTDGQEVGSVEDIVFDQDGKVIGVVLKIGGLLGIGGKSVGIKWEEVQVSTEDEIVQIKYSADQLEIAPDFKTQEAIAAEEALMNQQQQPAEPPAQ